MTRAGRLSAALLLAGVGLVSLINEVEAQNTRWELSIKIDPVRGYRRGWVTAQHEVGSITSANNSPWKFAVDKDTSTGEETGRAQSVHVDGGGIVIFCKKGEPLPRFFVGVVTSGSAIQQEERIAVSWRIDEGEVHAEMWHPIPRNTDQIDGYAIVRQPAKDFALAMAKAQNRIVFQTILGTQVYSAIGAKTAISELFDYCGLPQ